MRFLALDLGGKRTGAAVGDDRTGIVTPLEVIEAPPGEALMRAIARLVDEHGPAALIVGLPLNMDDTEGPAAKEARAFGTALQTTLAIPVLHHDERLTSFAADQAMARSGRTRGQKKAVRDAIAAAEILRDFLAARSRGEEQGGA